MSGKKKKKQSLTKKATVTAILTKNQKNNPKANWQKYLLPLIIILTLIIYIPSLFNDFIINWDDAGYIHEYEPIKSITLENLKIIFSDFYKGNYHPLTTLFYAVEYSLVGVSPFLYHLNNLILHLINIVLIYIFIKKLSGEKIVAAFCALFFGIHPMHVESVAWISERKDVLYTFFFLLSLIMYQNYLSKAGRKTKYYIVSIICFALSLLSKSAAVSLPLVLFLIDFFNKRALNFKNIIEKVPYFVLSIVFGLIAIASQDETGAIQNLTPLYSVLDRFFIVSYATINYLIKLFLPLNLSAMYPYPQLENGFLPTEYYIAGVALIIVVSLFLIFLRKNRNAVFGVLFFFATIALVLQILPVGGAVLAERYTYVPYTGLFFALAMGYHKISTSTKNFAKKLFPYLKFIIIVAIIAFSFLTYARIKIWQDGETVFTDVIKKNPTLPFAYGNRAFFYKKNELWDKTVKDYDKAISLNPEEKGLFAGRGEALYQLGRIEESARDFEKAYEQTPDDTDVLLGLANTYSSLKRYKDAIPFYNKYLQIKTDNSKAWLWRAVAYYYENKTDSAIADANKCIEINPLDDEAYYWKGVAYNKKGNFTEAVKFMDKSIELNPVRGEVYSWRGVAKQNMKQYKEAINDFNLAIKHNPNDAAAYLNRSSAHYQLMDFKSALKDADNAIKLGQQINPEYYKYLQLLVTEK